MTHSPPGLGWWVLSSCVKPSATDTNRSKPGADQGEAGDGTAGQAAQIAAQLRTAGYTVTGTGNAPKTAAATAVTYPPVLEQQSAALAARMKTPATQEADPDAAPGVVTLTVGPGYDRPQPGSRAPPWRMRATRGT
ncbi:LytR C-terminal domain-containing protein [Streptomyces sp. NPDC005407]|uniref:LytR C-terminal domain-containing protein n=1 Tax=Streptomyces sp. NPDC005407 TaxID=3155340 RepID=UPI0033B13A82